MATMNKRLLATCLFAATFVLMAAVAVAQQPKKPVAVPVVKYKPPVVKTFLGKFSGTTATCTAAEGTQIVALPLTITDAQNNAYPVSSYQFAYKRIGVTEDEETGKTSPQSDMVADRFTVTPLPEIWKTNITEQLHTGEELYFFDIVVKDKKGRLFFAPDLKITIQ
jgi:hypothetical protein